MTLLAKMDALQVHAAAAANAADTADAKFYDVAVGFPAAKGRCVRIFYGGEREPEHFNDAKTLNSRLIGQAIIVRGYWPLEETATKRQRAMEGEMAVFVKEFRTRVLLDSQLGGASSDLNISLAQCEQSVIANTKYALVDMEVITDYDEYTIAP